MFLFMPATHIRVSVRWPAFIQTERLPESFFVTLMTGANSIGYAMHYSRSHDAVIRVYDAGGNVTATHEQAGEFKEW
jgi:hypothetical protein